MKHGVLGISQSFTGRFRESQSCWYCMINIYYCKKNLAVYSAFIGRHPPTRRSKTANITKDDITLQHIATMSVCHIWSPFR